MAYLSKRDHGAWMDVLNVNLLSIHYKTDA
jgi:hypothetical protein